MYYRRTVNLWLGLCCICTVISELDDTYDWNMRDCGIVVLQDDVSIRSRSPVQYQHEANADIIGLVLLHTLDQWHSGRQ
ncbi:hypothetical protein C8Q69DRAFT_209605 [Paecilomyces variotii]|uniref:Secreted protein n=1 Tax=Byssochlamys spectabilis TaxID=264951 RepID=A0A443HYP5_BYSSP|nr:hypothetical protein C8Q69DRAFT_209605 [Paecilomyces variotii]RWQ96926.1 hypothetical protein C8Q69DRAFT_209605 [Paecilomyces variotii]